MRRNEPTCLVRWMFQRGRDVLTCAVESTDGQSSCDVWVLPHWDVSAATVEHFSSAAHALLRHAEIALQLRQHGWAAQYAMADQPSLAA
jgi:hypothetical protein